MKVRLELVINGGSDLQSIDAIIGLQKGIRIESQRQGSRGRLVLDVVAESGQAVSKLCRNLVFDCHVEAARVTYVD